MKYCLQKLFKKLAFYLSAVTVKKKLEAIKIISFEKTIVIIFWVVTYCHIEFSHHSLLFTTKVEEIFRIFLEFFRRNFTEKFMVLTVVALIRSQNIVVF